MKTSELIRMRFANASSSWLTSNEGRRLRAKSLRRVRKTEGHKVAKELANEICLFLAVPMPEDSE